MNFPERVRVDTSSRDRSPQGLRVTAPGEGRVQPGPAPPRPAPATWAGGGEVGVSKLAPRAPRDGTCARAASKTGARRLRIPRRLGGGACVAGVGARPGPARSWGGGGRLRAAPGACPRRWWGHTRRDPGGGAPTQKGNFALGGGWGGRRGLRLRCGGREGARLRKEKAARGGRELASRRQGDGGGVRLPRGNAGRSRRAWWGRLAEAAGAAGGGAARPKRRPRPPGTAPSSALRTRGEGGGVEKGPMRRELEGGSGVTHRLSRGRRSACPPQASGAAAPAPLLPPPPPPDPTPATATRARAGAGAGAAASAAAATDSAAPAPAPAACPRPRPRPCPCRARPRRRPSPRALSLVELLSRVGPRPQPNPASKPTRTPVQNRNPNNKHGQTQTSIRSPDPTIGFQSKYEPDITLGPHFLSTEI